MSRAEKQRRRIKRRERRASAERQRTNRFFNDLVSETQEYSLPEGLVVSRYMVTTEPLDLAGEARYTSKTIYQERKDELHDLIFNQPLAAIPQLMEELSRCPDDPVLLNWLAAAHQAAGNKEQYAELSQTLYDLHPDYLFARIGMANVCMERGELDRIPDIFKNKLDLKLMYPDRNVFHITEFINFSYTVATYYVRIGRHDLARIIARGMNEIAPEDMATQLVNDAISGSMLLQLARRLSHRLLGRGLPPV